MEIDTDEVLNLEQEYYQKGFEEGEAQGIREQFLEGKQYGYQTGFQKYLIVGYIQGLLDNWKTDIENYSHINGFVNHINQLEKYLKDIPMDNEELHVEEFDRIVHKARNKLRVVTTIAKEAWKSNLLDEIIRRVGGNIQVSTDEVDMW